MVPSPRPIEIVESNTIRRLVYRGVIVIAAGGGGVPVYRHPTLGLEGVDAVIDKDLAAALLGRQIGASTLLILTDVDMDSVLASHQAIFLNMDFQILKCPQQRIDFCGLLVG